MASRYGDSMNARLLGVALVLAVAGLAGGWYASDAISEEPATIDVLSPVIGRSPSFPSDPPVNVLPDPTTATLSAALPHHRERVGTKGFGLRLPVPDGWGRTDTSLSEAKWFLPNAPLNTYLLRVKIVSGLHQSVEMALGDRRVTLASVVTDFDLESVTADTFVASYVNDNYRRLAMERFIAKDGEVFATIAVIGRLSDRDGLQDLLERVTDGLVLD